MLGLEPPLEGCFIMLNRQHPEAAGSLQARRSRLVGAHFHNLKIRVQIIQQFMSCINHEKSDDGSISSHISMAHAKTAGGRHV